MPPVRSGGDGKAGQPPAVTRSHPPGDADALHGMLLGGTVGIHHVGKPAAVRLVGLMRMQEQGGKSRGWGWRNAVRLRLKGRPKGAVAAAAAITQQRQALAPLTFATGCCPAPPPAGVAG